MRNIVLKNQYSSQQLKQLMNSAKTKEEFRRWQSFYLIGEKKLRAEEVADIVNVSIKTIYQWIYYQNQGRDNTIGKQRGGRRKYLMSLQEEEEFLKELTAQSEKGAIVITKYVKDKIEAKLGHKISKDYPYDLFHRHGWRKVTPRAKHPNSKREDQEEFKKNYRSIWIPPF